MRALAQGLDERASWDRYLRHEGEHADLRTVRRTIAWIRDEFAAAAIRNNKPGTARLILLDADRFTSTASAAPSLAEFAEAQGLEDFSEAEQLEAYEQAYPATSLRGGQGRVGQLSRRARVIERQLEALRWLQGQVAEDPKPSDNVATWLHPNLARRLQRAGLGTIDALAERINAVGARWWVPVPGVGRVKARRIQDWIEANQSALGLHIGSHVGSPRRQLTASALAKVVPAATALRPYEKLVVPEALDGSRGTFRAPPEDCLIKATNDRDAIGAWLASKARVDGTASATQRAYRKEAERLLLWAVLERKKPLSSLSAADLADFEAFLSGPPAAWCGPRHHQRWSPMWRPLEGGLGPVALTHCRAVLRSLFAFFVRQRYVTTNPIATPSMPAASRRRSGSESPVFA